MKKKKKQITPIDDSDKLLTQPFEENDLLAQLESKKGSSLWLGRYSPDEIRRSLEACGILPDLRARGLDRFEIAIHPLEDFEQELRIYSHSPVEQALLAEARLREVLFCPKTPMQETFSRLRPKMLEIDWLMMQNPTATFTAERPPLPNQSHPGLGQARRVVKLLLHLCKKRKLSALVNYPQNFHNAYFYRSHFNFYDPAEEARLQAISRDLGHISLPVLSWAIELGCIEDVHCGEPFEWKSSAQISAVFPEIREYFSSAWYIEQVNSEMTKFKYVCNVDQFRTILASRKLPISNFIHALFEEDRKNE